MGSLMDNFMAKTKIKQGIPPDFNDKSELEKYKCANIVANQMINDFITVLTLISNGSRSDGTFNHCRESCQKMSEEVLKKHKYL